MSFLAPGFALSDAAVRGADRDPPHRAQPRQGAPLRRASSCSCAARSAWRAERKIRQWLLLLLRALAIAAVPLILAKPFVEAASAICRRRRSAAHSRRCIVIDDSMSMSARATRPAAPGSGAQRARGASSRRSAATPTRPSCWRRAAAARRCRSSPPIAPSSSAPSTDVRATYRATDVTGALKRAAQILESAARPERRVYLLSDLAAHGFTGEPPWAAGRGPELVPIDLTDGKPLANRAIVDLKTEPAPHLGPRGVRVSVEVANFGAEAAQGAAGHAARRRQAGDQGARRRAGARPRAEALLPRLHAVDATRAEIGVHELAGELPPDALAADDRRFARVEVRRDLRVLVVDGDPRTSRRDDEVFYLETALRPGDRDDSQLEVTTVAPDEVANRRLADFDVVFLCNVKAPDGAALKDYVRHGGGLFIALGDNVDADAYNDALGDLLPQPLQALRTVGATAADRDDGERQAAGAGDSASARIDRNHPLLAPLGRAARRRGAGGGALLPLRAVPPHRGGAAPGAAPLRRRRAGADRVALRRRARALVGVDRSIATGPICRSSRRSCRWCSSRRATWRARRCASRRRRSSSGSTTTSRCVDGDLRVEVTQPSGRQRTFDRDKVVGRKALALRRHRRARHLPRRHRRARRRACARAATPPSSSTSTPPSRT